MSDEKLQPCPFCGSEDVRVVEEYSCNKGEMLYQGYCFHCGARGPGFPQSYDHRIYRYWNRRKSEPVEPPLACVSCGHAPVKTEWFGDGWRVFCTYCDQKVDTQVFPDHEDAIRHWNKKIRAFKKEHLTANQEPKE